MMREDELRGVGERKSGQASFDEKLKIWPTALEKKGKPFPFSDAFIKQTKF
jgi:hypothetical protein